MARFEGPFISGLLHLQHNSTVAPHQYGSRGTIYPRSRDAAKYRARPCSCFTQSRLRNCVAVVARTLHMDTQPNHAFPERLNVLKCKAPNAHCSHFEKISHHRLIHTIFPARTSPFAHPSRATVAPRVGSQESVRISGARASPCNEQAARMQAATK
jgi:hypothetical protein